MPKPPIEELDYALTPLGELILRRRAVASLGGVEVFEVKLDGQFLMSSLVNGAEIALATIALDAAEGTERDVLVGGLGLGHTAQTALDAPDVRSVTVVEYLERIIDWHRRDLVPAASRLLNDPRCTVLHGDFFALVSGSAPIGGGRLPESAGPPAPAAERFHAILVDIDHSPDCLLQAHHAAFYTAAGLSSSRERLHAGGVFALWSADAPQETFLSHLRSAFGNADVHELRFFHPLLNEEDVNYIIVARHR